MSGYAQAGGALLSAYGDVQQGKMTSNSLNAQADNLMSQAQEAEQAGQYNALRQSISSGMKIGTSIAAYGASGVSTNYGSAAAVIEASNQNAEMDRLNILHGADVKAINYENQASMDRYGAQSAVLGSYWQALGALTGGAVKISANTPSGGGQSNSSMAGGSDGGGEGAGLASDASDAGEMMA